jgi:hypothetical protein
MPWSSSSTNSFSGITGGSWREPGSPPADCRIANHCSAFCEIPLHLLRGFAKFYSLNSIS